MEVKRYARSRAKKGLNFAAGGIVRALDLRCSTALVRNALKDPRGPVYAAASAGVGVRCDIG